MFKNLLSVSLFFALILAACSTSKDTAGVWLNKEKIAGKSYKNIFIYVASADIQARSYVESEIANTAVSKGYTAVKSIDIIKPSLDNPQLPGQDQLKQAIAQTSCDGAFMVTLLKKEESVRYTPGTTAYAPYPYYSFHGNMWGYYSYYQPTISTPGYYSKDKEYFIQSNLYDVKTEELMMSIQSEIYNPTSVSNFSKMYIKDIVKQMEKEGLLKK
jgi:hypothetical protein